VQVVGYQSRVESPAALRIAEEGVVRAERLEPGTELAYTLGERHCAGTVDGDTHLVLPGPHGPLALCAVYR
jgi:hypothetical protein